MPAIRVPHSSTRRGARGFACWSGLLALLLLVLSGVPAHARTSAPPRATHIVQFQPQVPPNEEARIVRAAGGRAGRSVPLIHAVGARLDAHAIARLGRDPRVRAVTPNGRVAPQASRIDATALTTTYPASVMAPGAWGTATGAGITVAVIDTGIDGGEPDFNRADGNSRVIGSAVVNPLASTATDRYGHGTHVAGIIAGDGTRRDAADPDRNHYVGIAPDANLVSIKIADDDGGATVLDAIYGLEFAVDHRDEYGIRIVNLSLESAVAESYLTDPLDAAVEAAWLHGIVVVAAAGNRGSDPDAVQYAPGNDPYAVTVGAANDQGTTSQKDDVVTPWSSRGTTQDGFAKPDVVAPGSGLVSTLPAGSTYANLCPSCMVGDGYFRASGTSMSAPVVAGVAALLLQAHPSWTPDQVKRALRRSGDMAGSAIGEVNATGVLLSTWSPTAANAGLQPNSLIDTTTGGIDYTRSSWSRSSWSSAPGDLTASWARSSWSCDCSKLSSGEVDPARSSWSRSSWSTRLGS